MDCPARFPWITIVSGLPRSGTSMMMQMLKAGGMPVLSDDIRKSDDDNPRGYFELDAVKRTRRDPSWLSGARGKVVKLVHLLLMDLPLRHEAQDLSYRVIFLRRQMSEVLASQKTMLARQNRRGAALPDDRLAALYSEQLRQVERWLAERASSFSVLDVNYADVLTDPAAQAHRINIFLGGSLDETAMASAVDPSLYRNKG
jgi:hypothetical protein